MAFIDSILAIVEPTGFWANIISSFEGFTGNYVLAVILLTLILRLIWVPLDTINKRISSKNTKIQILLKPELDKLKKQYANDPQKLNQKTSELYKKYNYGAMGSCGVMAIVMIFNILVFFTLCSSLNTIGRYKTYSSYENLKDLYANCLNVTDTYLKETSTAGQENFKSYENLSYEIGSSNDTKTIKLVQNGNTLKEISYITQTDFEPTASSTAEELYNVYINELISAYITPDTDVTLIEEVEEGGVVTTEGLTLSEAITYVVDEAIATEYEATQESFLWIQNIWVADSPFKSSILSYDGFVSAVNSSNISEGEETIYNAFMTNLQTSHNATNGYFILPILCFVFSFLQMWLTMRKNKGVASTGSSKIMMYVMPVIMFIFAMMYNALFAIYIVVGQIISTLFLPLENFIVKKLEDRADKKAAQKNPQVIDYRRK